MSRDSRFSDFTSKAIASGGIFIRSANNYDMMAASDESGLKCEDPSLAQQSAKDECDINCILQNMARGVHPDVSGRQPQYGDFTSTANDYHDALNMVIAAKEAFDGLSADVRARFKNDPAELLDFVHNEENREEAISLGLIPPPPKVEDLSIAVPKRGQRAGEGTAVEKSGRDAKASQRASKAPYEGDEGEE